MEPREGLAAVLHRPARQDQAQHAEEGRPRDRHLRALGGHRQAAQEDTGAGQERADEVLGPAERGVAVPVGGVADQVLLFADVPPEEHVGDDGQQGRHDPLPAEEPLRPRAQLPQVHGVPRHRPLFGRSEARPAAGVQQLGPPAEVQHRVYGLHGLAAGLQEYGEAECREDGARGALLGDQRQDLLCQVHQADARPAGLAGSQGQGHTQKQPQDQEDLRQVSGGP